MAPSSSDPQATAAGTSRAKPTEATAGASAAGSSGAAQITKETATVTDLGVVGSHRVRLLLIARMDLFAFYNRMHPFQHILSQLFQRMPLRATVPCHRKEVEVVSTGLQDKEQTQAGNEAKADTGKAAGSLKRIQPDEDRSAGEQTAKRAA